MRIFPRLSALASIVLVATAVAQPQYQIFDIGVVQKGDTASQGFGVSPGGVAVGRSFSSSGTEAFSWTQSGGLVGLPNFPGSPDCRADSANDSGIVVGTGATTPFGSNRVPLIWQNGTVKELPLPSGESIGEATSVNSLGIAVGSVDGGISQQGVIYKGASSAILTEATSTGCTFVAAFGINNAGRIVGFGIDPNNAARNVGIVLDFGQSQAFEVGALPGFNGAIAFAVGNGGHVVGSSMLNQGSGLPFIYSDANGIVAIPLATGTSQGSARGVNSKGWVVGDDSNAFSIPFLWDGTTTYRIADLLPPNSGWDLDMNTSSSAMGISDNGVIVGTGVHNGETHAYAMVPVSGSPTPSPTATPTPSPISIDFGITMQAPGQVPIQSTITYSMTITNHSAGDADNGVVQDNLPASVSFVSVNPSQGTCTGTSMINCNLGPVPGMGSATVTLIVQANQNTTVTNTATVLYPDDPNPSNNSATVMTNVVIPTPSPTLSPTATPSPSVGTPSPSPPPSPNPVQALNLSTRMRVETGDNVGIGGFIITGTDPKQVLLRGIGPSLADQGVPDPLADPVIELHGPSGFQTITNDNWKDTQPAAIMATGLAPTNDLESAILVTLDPGAYTAIVKGNNNGSGVGLVEAYDLGFGANSKLANISTRCLVQTGNDIMIAGFILFGGTGDDNVILRGIGPVGVPNPLLDPKLELRDGSGTLIIMNDNCGDDPGQAAIVAAAGLTPPNPTDACIAATLHSGLYTALLSGVNNSTGVGLVEIYDIGQGSVIPTPTPGNTATPTATATAGGPTPTATATAGGPSPSPSAGPPCTENWDSVTAPALPAGWVASNPDPGDGTMWVTSTVTPDSAPNDAFVPDQDGISDKVLDRLSVSVSSSSPVMSFRNNFNTEFSDGIYWDGYVLEVSAPNISGGDFLDITDPHVGGSFVSGGYTGEIDGSGTANNPLSGRMAWSSDSGGYIDTVINMGPNLFGQTVTLRFRMGTDEAVAAPGVRIDNFSMTGASCP